RKLVGNRSRDLTYFRKSRRVGKRSRRSLSSPEKTVPQSGCPKTGRAFSRFLTRIFLTCGWTQMRTFLAALLEKTGIRWFFSGLPVELPPYFLPNFQVVELSEVRRKARRGSPYSR